MIGFKHFQLPNSILNVVMDDDDDKTLSEQRVNLQFEEKSLKK